MALSRIERRKRIHYRIRKHVSGTAESDDLQGKTLAAASSNDKELAAQCKGKSGIEAAAIVGKTIAERAQAKGINAVSFDRGGYLFHGRVKSLADAAREGGLEF